VKGLKAILKPSITEKSFVKSGQGWYTFVAEKGLKKNQARILIEKIFGVNVEEIKSTGVKGKVRRSLRNRRLTVKQDTKKFLVKIAKDQKIDLFETGGGK